VRVVPIVKVRETPCGAQPFTGQLYHRSGEQTQVIDRLVKRFGKYALVAGVSKRAQDLKERVDSTFEPSGGGIVKRAIREIARGDVKLWGEEPDEETEQGP
jgi:DNA-directed RNA polymerase subunit K/omega